MFNYKDSIFLHEFRVALLSNKLCKKLNLTFKMKAIIFTGSLLHDVGKYSINKVIIKNNVF